MLNLGLELDLGHEKLAARTNCLYSTTVHTSGESLLVLVLILGQGLELAVDPSVFPFIPGLEERRNQMAGEGS